MSSVDSSFAFVGGCALGRQQSLYRGSMAAPASLRPSSACPPRPWPRTAIVQRRRDRPTRRQQGGRTGAAHLLGALAEVAEGVGSTWHWRAVVLETLHVPAPCGRDQRCLATVTVRAPLSSACALASSSRRATRALPRALLPPEAKRAWCRVVPSCSCCCGPCVSSSKRMTSSSPVQAANVSTVSPAQTDHPAALVMLEYSGTRIATTHIHVRKYRYTCTS
jgi:hypothetical protein